MDLNLSARLGRNAIPKLEEISTEELTTDIFWKRNKLNEKNLSTIWNSEQRNIIQPLYNKRIPFLNNTEIQNIPLEEIFEQARKQPQLSHYRLQKIIGENLTLAGKVIQQKAHSTATEIITQMMSYITQIDFDDTQLYTMVSTLADNMAKDYNFVLGVKVSEYLIHLRNETNVHEIKMRYHNVANLISYIILNKIPRYNTETKSILDLDRRLGNNKISPLDIFEFENVYFARLDNPDLVEQEIYTRIATIIQERGKNPRKIYRKADICQNHAQHICKLELNYRKLLHGESIQSFFNRLTKEKN